MGLGSIVKKVTGAVKSVAGISSDTLGGSLLSGGLSLLGGSMQNSAMQANSREQMDFQERMRATAYQTAVKDMKAAGLNPALAYGQGPAPTPSGASAGATDVVTPALATALQARMARAQLDNIAADTASKREQARKTNIEGTLAEKNVPMADLQNEIMKKVIDTGKRVSSSSWSAASRFKDDVSARWSKDNADYQRRNSARDAIRARHDSTR